MNKSFALLTAVALPALVLTPEVEAATVITIDSFNPSTFFSGGVTAGLDFNDDTNTTLAGNQYVTQAGFLSVPHSTTTKNYLLTHNGITFDIDVTNANLNNENRDRGPGTAPNFHGDLVRDFEQWHGNVANSPVEASFVLTGLVANTDYDLSFFTMNIGAGNVTHSFYEGTSSAAPLITTFTTSGAPNNYSTWKPGITFRINSGSTATIAVTVQATQGASPGFDSRLTFDGLSVVQGATIPEPGSLALMGLGGLIIARRRRD